MGNPWLAVPVRSGSGGRLVGETSDSCRQRRCVQRRPGGSRDAGPGSAGTCSCSSAARSPATGSGVPGRRESVSRRSREPHCSMRHCPGQWRRLHTFAASGARAWLRQIPWIVRGRTMKTMPWENPCCRLPAEAESNAQSCGESVDEVPVFRSRHVVRKTRRSRPARETAWPWWLRRPRRPGHCCSGDLPETRRTPGGLACTPGNSPPGPPRR